MPVELNTNKISDVYIGTKEVLDILVGDKSVFTTEDSRPLYAVRSAAGSQLVKVDKESASNSTVVFNLPSNPGTGIQGGFYADGNYYVVRADSLGSFYRIDFENETLVYAGRLRGGVVQAATAYGKDIYYVVYISTGQITRLLKTNIDNLSSTTTVLTLGSNVQEITRSITYHQGRLYTSRLPGVIDSWQLNGMGRIGPKTGVALFDGLASDGNTIYGIRQSGGRMFTYDPATHTDSSLGSLPGALGNWTSLISNSNPVPQYDVFQSITASETTLTGLPAVGTTVNYMIIGQGGGNGGNGQVLREGTFIGGRGGLGAPGKVHSGSFTVTSGRIYKVQRSGYDTKFFYTQSDSNTDIVVAKRGAGGGGGGASIGAEHLGFGRGGTGGDGYGRGGNGGQSGFDQGATGGQAGGYDGTNGRSGRRKNTGDSNYLSGDPGGTATLQTNPPIWENANYDRTGITLGDTTAGGGNSFSGGIWLSWE